MKQLIALVATAFAVSVFAADVPKTVAAPVAKPAASAAKSVKKEQPKKADTKSTPASDKKAEAAKK